MNQSVTRLFVGQPRLHWVCQTDTGSANRTWRSGGDEGWKQRQQEESIVSLVIIQHKEETMTQIKVIR